MENNKLLIYCSDNKHPSAGYDYDNCLSSHLIITFSPSTVNLLGLVFLADHRDLFLREQEAFFLTSQFI